MNSSKRASSCGRQVVGPSPPTRRRWLGVWLAEERGTVLPPVSLAAVGDAFAIRDGHHRVSVARARGARTITAIVA